ncbi:MAG TPA: hypothetical protein PKA62_03565 [Thermoanaerobaculia bacterium]|nr:hypothetical protein [Thermoanaerobaculia bacterium]
MSRRSLFWLAVVAGVAFWLWKSGTVSKEEGPVRSSAAGTGIGAPAAAGEACLFAAEEASRLTQEAADVLLRPPIDPALFSAASERASASIASAEGKCGGGSSAAEQRAMEEVRGALSEMRGLLADLSGALSGSGSASDAPRRRETIDRRLDAARAALRG